MTKPRNIGTFLEGTSDSLQRSIQRAAQLGRLDRAVKSLLPAEMATHCQVANLREKVLFLQTDTNAWATRLRYQSPQLLSALQQQLGLKQLHKIEINVSPLSTPRKQAKRTIKLSPQSAATITATAESTEDPKLRAALLRLAKRAKQE